MDDDLKKTVLEYEPPMLKSFSYGQISIIEGWSGVDCPPAKPQSEDDYGV